MKTNMDKGRLLASTLLAGVAAFGAPALVGGVALMSATDAMAQSYTSVDFVGRVTSPTGAPVSGATVVATSDQGTTRTTTTNADGFYRFSAVPAGAYTVSISASGFGAVDDRPVRLAPGASAFNFALNEAGGSGDIVVTAARVSSFNATDNGATYDVQELASRIPLGRNINAAVLLTPSAGLADASIQANGVRRNQSAVSLSGASAAENAYYINGFNVTDQRTFLGYADLPFEMIQSIDVKTGGYSAEYGRGTGGVVNIVTRSGSNDWHGGISAYYAPNSMRETRGAAYAPGGNNSVGQQVFNQYSEAESSEQTLWASGPIVKDHIFFFGLYNARQFDNWGPLTFTNTTTANGTRLNTQANDPRMAMKLDFVLNENHRLEVTYFNDEETTDYRPFNVARSTMQITAPLNTYEQEAGGETTIYQYTGTFTDWFTLTALYGTNTSAYHDYGPNIERPGILDFGYLAGANATTGRQGGPFNLSGEDERTTYRINADFYFNALGEHHLRVGADKEELTSSAVSAYSGGALYYAYAQADCPAGAGPDGCVELITFANVGSYEAEQTAYYIQDQWDVSDSLTLNLGLRTDIYDYLNSSGQTYISIDNQIAPRLGFEWRPFADGATRITGFVGDYYLPIATNTSIRASSGEIYTDAYYQTDRTGTCTTSTACAPLVIDANGFPVVGAQIGTTTYLSPPGGPDPRSVVEKDLEPMYEREFTLGFEHDFSQGILDGWTMGVQLTHRNLESTIEDTAIGDALDRYCQRTGDAICAGFLGTNYVSYYPYVLINPGDGATVYVDMEADPRTLGPGVDNPAFDPVYVNLTAEDLALPDAERTYDAMIITWERPFDGVWGLQGSYTLAHSQGNYEGAIKSDIGQTDTSITQDFDHAINMVGAYGDLPNDHRHTLKLFGTWAPMERLTIGANFTLQSGRPYGCIGYGISADPDYAPNAGTPGSWYCPQGASTGTPVGSLQSQLTAVGLPGQTTHDSVLVGRGNAGTTDWVNQIDLSMAYRIVGNEDGEGHQMVGTIDIFNLFDNDAVTRVVEQGEVRTSATGQKGVAAPFYGLPRTYQAGRSVRFGLRYSF